MGEKNRACKEKQLGVDQEPPSGNRVEEDTREMGWGQTRQGLGAQVEILNFILFFSSAFYVI